MHSISLQRRIEDGKKIPTLSENIKNNFKERNMLIIKDLIEEIVVNL